MPQAAVGENRPLRDEYNAINQQLKPLQAQFNALGEKLKGVNSPDGADATTEEWRGYIEEYKSLAKQTQELSNKYDDVKARTQNANPYDPGLIKACESNGNIAYDISKNSDKNAKQFESAVDQASKDAKGKKDQEAAKADETAKTTEQQSAAGQAGQAGEAPGNQQVEDNKSAGTEQTYSSPSETRLRGAGLNTNGETTNSSGGYVSSPVVVFTNQTGRVKEKLKDDWRVKVSLAPKSDIFYNSNNPGIMSRLRATQGAIFPYTPEISVTHTARYAESKLTHSNYASYFYEGSEVSAINIKGEYTVQTPDEGVYLLAVISFFRSCTKMFFGTQSQKLAGSPPPMVFLSGYGKYYFPDVPCVLTSFQHTMPSDCDYIDVIEDTTVFNQDVALSDGSMYKSEAAILAQAVTRVPVMSAVSITLQPVYSRKTLHEDFNLEKFANGDLLANRGGFI